MTLMRNDADDVQIFGVHTTGRSQEALWRSGRSKCSARDADVASSFDANEDAQWI
jgi:hypothetical protein